MNFELHNGLANFGRKFSMDATDLFIKQQGYFYRHDQGGGSYRFLVIARQGGAKYHTL